LTAVSSYKRPLDMYVTVHKISNETVIEREMILACGPLITFQSVIQWKLLEVLNNHW
jgi:hypothetical protein